MQSAREVLQLPEPRLCRRPQDQGGSVLGHLHGDQRRPGRLRASRGRLQGVRRRSRQADEDPRGAGAVRAAPPGAERDALLHGLGGWLALFEANIIDSPEGRALMREIVDAEAVLFDEKRAHEPRHLNEHGRVGGGVAADAGDQPGDQPRRGAAQELVRRVPRDRTLGARARISGAGPAPQPFCPRARLRQLLRR